jgi:hypothetical protein
MEPPAPVTRVRTKPSPERAQRAHRRARWILTSGRLEARADGLFLQPDAFWARVFGCPDGWFVARWCDVATIELARGGRYSLFRGRLRVLDGEGDRVFLGEVDLHDAYRLLADARPNGAPFAVELEKGFFAARRYSVAGLAVGRVNG